MNTKYIFVEKKKKNNYGLAEYPIGSQVLAEYLALVWPWLSHLPLWALMFSSVNEKVKFLSLVSALKSQNVFKYIFPSHRIFGLVHQYGFTGEICPLIFTLVTNIFAWWWWFSCYVMFDSCDPMDCSLPGSSVPGILQARVLEWVAISFSLHPFHWKHGVLNHWTTREVPLWVKLKKREKSSTGIILIHLLWQSLNDNSRILASKVCDSHFSSISIIDSFYFCQS